MTNKAKVINTGLVYVIVLCFIGLLLTAFYLHKYMNRCRELDLHKKVLIDRLAEEVHDKGVFKHKYDSLVNYVNEGKMLPLAEDTAQSK